MVEEINDSEYFQQDFTTASEWENFNARLEEIFNEWNLPYSTVQQQLKQNELYKAEWTTEQEIIYFANVELLVSRHTAKLSQGGTSQDVIPSYQNLLNPNHTFCIFDDLSKKVHPLVCWYGLQEFVIIEPTGDAIYNQSQIHVLLSSVAMTVAESKVVVPVFIYVLPKDLHIYLGVSEHLSNRIYFDQVFLETIPPMYKHLSGLLGMFKGKIKSNTIQPIEAAVRLTYSLKEFLNNYFILKRNNPFFDDIEIEDDNISKLKYYFWPFGVSLDPVNEILLNCIWPKVIENVVVDSVVYSDFDPMIAPKWSIRVDFLQNPIYYMTECIGEYIKLIDCEKTIADILGAGYEIGRNQCLEEGNPLDRLTETNLPRFTSMLPALATKMITEKKNSKSTIVGPIKNDDLLKILYYLFPDAQENLKDPYENVTQEMNDPIKIKSCPADSLVMRLSLLLAVCNYYMGGLAAVAQLWAEFTQEMRYRCENGFNITGLFDGVLDYRSCLLHQKLQMLNICIQRRKLQHEIKKTTDQNESEDEFYDCAEEPEETEFLPKQPEGRRSKLGDLTLIGTNTPLYIPITQEQVPKTEDQLEDDAEVMLKLGPGSELCTQMMSASLLSDMESFKAANPEGKLEDFIRWYSPVDWVKNEGEESSEGHLSERMKLPGNTWQTVWKSAKPIPAKRQKRLFDDTRESEKVLHFLETRTIAQVCELTCVALYHSASLKLQEEIKIADFSDDYMPAMNKLITNISKISRENWKIKLNLVKKLDIILQEISYMEQNIIKAQSIEGKLFPDELKLNSSKKEILQHLVNGWEAELNGAAGNDISKQILKMFNDVKLSKNEFQNETNQQKKQLLPNPKRKEYVLRASNSSIGNDKGGPNFLRVILEDNIRLCGAFSQNTTFI